MMAVYQAASTETGERTLDISHLFCQRAKLLKLTDNMAHMRIRAEVSNECRAPSTLHLFKHIGSHRAMKIRNTLR